MGEILAVDERFHKIDHLMRDRHGGEIALREMSQDLQVRVDNEEKSRIAGDGRLEKALRDALTPIQSSVQDEVSRWKSAIPTSMSRSNQ